ncbi:MAG: DUF4173 domain-containing protein [Pyrinomonadaceae bacterium]
MKDTTKTGRAILAVALIIGLLGDLLLRSTPWGLNVTIFNIAFVAGLVWLLRRYAPEQLTRQTYSLLGALIFFATMFSWRASHELLVADGFAIVGILGLLFLPRLGITARVAGVFQYGVAFFWAALNAAFAPAALLSVDIEWKATSTGGWSRHAIAAARGVAIAAPIVLIFGGLFMAADAAYSGWVQQVFNFPTFDFSHVVLFSVFSWLSAGYLRGILISAAPLAAAAAVVSPVPTAGPAESKVDRVTRESGEHPMTLGDRNVVEHINISDPPDAKAETRAAESVPFEAPTPDEKPKTTWQWAQIDNAVLPTVFTLGAVEIGVILGLINLLFLSFVIVQVPYLFGGMALVQNTPDFKLAEYARRGFGELVAVAGLVLPILLVSHWLIKGGNSFTHKLFRILAGVQIGLLFVIMASAVQRLVLLTGNLGYGLTTVRLYPLIFMVWLAIVFVWFGATVLRGARQHFAWGALWSAFLILGSTHVLNPDALIVKTNIALMREGRDFDAYYNSELSDDALPTLWDALPEMNDLDQTRITLGLARRYCEKRVETDFRGWNLSRDVATNTLGENPAFVEAVGGCDSKLIQYRHYGGD